MAGSVGDMDHRRLITSFAQDNPTVPAIQFIRDDPEGVIIDVIPDALNHLFRVKSPEGNESVIIKHSESHSDGAPGVKLPLKRQKLEYDCMLLMDSIQHGSVPTPYCLDTTHNIIAMRDLSDWELLWDQVVVKREINLDAAAHVAQLLGTLHTQTSRNNVTQQRWEELKAKFKHDDIRDIISNLQHSNHYDEHDKDNKIPEEFLPSYRKLVNDIKQQGLDTKVMEIVEEEVCLIHADCHNRNIFVKDGKTALIDFEFAFLGHPAANLGLLVQGYVFTYILGEAHQDQRESTSHTLTAKCKQAIRTLLEAYLEYRTDLRNNEGELREFFSALALLTGSFVFLIGGRAFNTMSGCVGMHRSDRGPLMTHAHKLMTNHHKMPTLDEFMDLV